VINRHCSTAITIDRTAPPIEVSIPTFSAIAMNAATTFAARTMYHLCKNEPSPFSAGQPQVNVRLFQADLQTGNPGMMRPFTCCL
jgi:hypothetical protein